VSQYPALQCHSTLLWRVTGSSPARVSLFQSLHCHCHVIGKPPLLPFFFHFFSLQTHQQGCLAAPLPPKRSLQPLEAESRGAEFGIFSPFSLFFWGQIINRLSVPPLPPGEASGPGGRGRGSRKSSGTAARLEAPRKSRTQKNLFQVYHCLQCCTLYVYSTLHTGHFTQYTIGRQPGSLSKCPKTHSSHNPLLPPFFFVLFVESPSRSAGMAEPAWHAPVPPQATWTPAVHLRVASPRRPKGGGMAQGGMGQGGMRQG